VLQFKTPTSETCYFET